MTSRSPSDMSHVRDGDLEVISSSLDMLGVNYYTRYVVCAPDMPDGGDNRWRSAPSAFPGSEHVQFKDRGLPVTAMNWEIDAPGLLETLRRLRDDYPAIPLVITENGAAFADDRLADDGRVLDDDRVAYLDSHLRVCRQATEEGIPLQGYLAWSLMDNFEWAWGYGKRFGIVHVDYPTQRRTPKSSARWYADVIAHHGLPTSAPA